MRFLLGRLGQAVFLLAGLSVLAFGLMELAPGDYLGEMRMSPEIGPEAVERVRVEYGLDGPVWERYGRWVGSMARGEWGRSMAYGAPVGELLWPRVGKTLVLAGLALLLSWGVGVPLGMWSAWRPGGWVDRGAGAASLGLGSTPDVLVGLGVVMAGLRFGVGAVHENLWLGAGTLALVGFPAVFRHTRSSVAGALRQPSMAHLRACGVSERRIVLRYAARAAANPMVNLLGLAVAGLTSSSLVIEAVMGWPGMGTLLLEAILARDAHVVLAAVMVSGGLLTLGNLAADVALWLVDPRIRRTGR